MQPGLRSQETMFRFKGGEIALSIPILKSIWIGLTQMKLSAKMERTEQLLNFNTKAGLKNPKVLDFASQRFRRWSTSGVPPVSNTSAPLRCLGSEPSGC